MSAKQPTQPIYGYLAEYDSPSTLISAVKSVKSEGYVEMEAYTPMPLHAVTEALGYKNRLPLLVLIGGLTGLCVGFGLCYWVSVLEYPLNIGGKPYNSWPAFIVPTFETTILFASLTAVFGMLALNGLPQPYHPVFNVPHFVEASRSRFFLMVLSRDPRFDLQGTKNFLAKLKPISLEEVPH
jgi:hypothetical protein